MPMLGTKYVDQHEKNNNNKNRPSQLLKLVSRKKEVGNLTSVKTFC